MYKWTLKLNGEDYTLKSGDKIIFQLLGRGGFYNIRFLTPDGYAEVWRDGASRGKQHFSSFSKQDSSAVRTTVELISLLTGLAFEYIEDESTSFESTYRLVETPPN